MPYRHAHYFLLLLFPLTGLAFWPGYFADWANAPWAFHVHGVTASLWIALLAFQSWSIHQRRTSWHRTVGYSSFVLFPFFLAGGLLVLQTMAAKFLAQADPFYVMYGARLGTVDTLSPIAIGWLYFMALRRRRKVHLHARYMLATVFFLLSPILSRILPALPPLAITGPENLYRFGYGFHLANFAAIGLALALRRGAPKHGRPWLILAGCLAAQSVLFETVGKAAAWEGAFAMLAAVPVGVVVSLTLAVGVAVTWWGWALGSVERRVVAAA